MAVSLLDDINEKLILPISSPSILILQAFKYSTVPVLSWYSCGVQTPTMFLPFDIALNVAISLFVFSKIFMPFNDRTYMSWLNCPCLIQISTFRASPSEFVFETDLHAGVADAVPRNEKTMIKLQVRKTGLFAFFGGSISERFSTAPASLR